MIVASFLGPTCILCLW